MTKRRDMPQSTLAWVKATILGASLTGTIACGGSQPQHDAPTCGPCCHGGGPECEQMQMETVGDEEEEDVYADEQLEVEEPEEAPTCGPCCHGSDDPECDNY